MILSHDCDLTICYDNDNTECTCTDCEDTAELIPNNKSCPFFNYRFREGELLRVLDKERGDAFVEYYKDCVKYYEFNEYSLQFLFKIFKVDNEQVPTLIRVTEEDINNFEFKISLEGEIFYTDNNQMSFAEELIGA